MEKKQSIFFLKQAYHGNVQCIRIQKKFVHFLHCSVMRRGKDTTARVRSNPPPSNPLPYPGTSWNIAPPRPLPNIITTDIESLQHNLHTPKPNPVPRYQEASITPPYPPSWPRTLAPSPCSKRRSMTHSWRKILIIDDPYTKIINSSIIHLSFHALYTVHI